MIRIQKILFPTDFSPSASQALNHAVYLAQKYRAELHMLHVIVLHQDDPYNPEHHFPDLESIHARVRELAAQQMTASVEQQEMADLVIKRTQRREVSAAPAIVEYAEEQDIDLIVMGTHGRRGVRHLLVGSVTEEVVRMAPCAVLSVRSKGEPRPLSEIRHVLAPVDFSEDSQEALRVARNVAANYEADLQVLHVWENVVHPAFYNMGAMSIKDIQPDIEERTMKAMRDLYTATEGRNVRVEYFAVEGHAAREIVHFAEEHESDIIVISTHGLTGMNHFLLGSVSEKVVRRAPCPVLVVKRKRSLVTS